MTALVFIVSAALDALFQNSSRFAQLSVPSSSASGRHEAIPKYWVFSLSSSISPTEVEVVVMVRRHFCFVLCPRCVYDGGVGN